MPVFLPDAGPSCRAPDRCLHRIALAGAGPYYRMPNNSAPLS
jgi:hypothetical protein